MVNSPNNHSTRPSPRRASSSTPFSRRQPKTPRQRRRGSAGGRHLPPAPAAAGAAAVDVLSTADFDSSDGGSTCTQTAVTPPNATHRVGARAQDNKLARACAYFFCLRAARDAAQRAGAQHTVDTPPPSPPTAPALLPPPPSTRTAGALPRLNLALRLDVSLRTRAAPPLPLPLPLSAASAASWVAMSPGPDRATCGPARHGPRTGAGVRGTRATRSQRRLRVAPYSPPLTQIPVVHKPAPPSIHYSHPPGHAPSWRRLRAGLPPTRCGPATTPPPAQTSAPTCWSR